MAKVSLLGIPHDDNSSYLKGPAAAPALIRRELASDAHSSWSETGFDVADSFLDHGDIDFSGGGDHAIAWPVLRAVRRRHPRLTIVQIDAHPDIYDAYQGNKRSHTSSFARILEEGLADRLIQIGLRTLNDELRDQLERFGVEVIEARHFSEDLRLDLKTPVYLSVDLDGLDPACAPGVSHREPGGLTTRQVINLIQRIDQPIVGADVVEYNVNQDVSNLTALVAAKLVKEIAGMMVKTNGAA